jgi:hypothetical protein
LPEGFRTVFRAPSHVRGGWATGQMLAIRIRREGNDVISYE